MSCTGTGQCGGTGDCLFAVRRCVSDFSVTCPNGLDSECPAGGCLFQAQLYTQLSAALTQWRDDPVSITATELLVRVWLRGGAGG